MRADDAAESKKITKTTAPESTESPGRPKKRGWPAKLLISVGKSAIVVAIPGVPALWYEHTTSTLASHYFTNPQNYTYKQVTGIPLIESPLAKRQGISEMEKITQSFTDNGYERTGAAPQWTQISTLGVDLYPMPDNVTSLPQQHGLAIIGTNDIKTSQAEFPNQIFDEQNQVPRVVEDMLLEFEDKALLEDHPKNWSPAVNGPRAVNAALASAVRFFTSKANIHFGWVDNAGGASTLVMEYLKNQYAKNGRTGGFVNKFRQMLTAEEFVYSRGTDTTWVKPFIVPAILNIVSFSATKGHGENLGYAEALQNLFGRNFEESNRLLSKDPDTMDEAELKEAAKAVREAGILIAAFKNTSRSFLDQENFDKTQTRFENFLPRFRMHPRLRAAVMASPRLDYYKDILKSVHPEANTRDKWEMTLRKAFLKATGVKGLPESDQLDAKMVTSIDQDASKFVAEKFQSYYDWDNLVKAGLTGDRQLGKVDYQNVRYTMLLMKAGKDYQPNNTIIDFDTADGKFGLNPQYNMNDGEYEMGSIMKNWIVAIYLEQIKQLRDEYINVDPSSFPKITADNPNKRWVLDYLSNPNNDKSLDAMQAASLKRRYSGAPASFVTGGGVQAFGNDQKDEGGIYTIEDAFAKSVNLVFIRLLHDTIKGIQYENLHVTPELFTDPSHPMRRTLLEEYIYRQSALYTENAWSEFKGKDPLEVMSLLAAKTGGGATNLATLLLTLKPEASFEEFQTFYAEKGNGEAEEEKELRRIYDLHQPHPMLNIESVLAKQTDMTAGQLMKLIVLMNPDSDYHMARTCLTELNPALGPFKDFNKEYQAAKQDVVTDPLTALVKLTDKSSVQVGALYGRMMPGGSYQDMKAFIIRNSTDKDRKWKDYKSLHQAYASGKYTPGEMVYSFDWQDRASLINRGKKHKTDPAVIIMAQWQMQRPLTRQIWALEQRLHDATSDTMREYLMEQIRPLKKQQWDKSSFIEVTTSTQAAQLEANRWLLRVDKKTGLTPPKLMQGQNNKIWQQLEVNAFKVLYKQWKNWGFNREGNIYSLGIVLGSSGMNPRDMTNFYGIIQRGGYKAANTSAPAIYFPASNTLLVQEFRKKSAAPEPVMAPETAKNLKQLTRGVVTDGTGKKLNMDFGYGIYVYGKTGSGSSKQQVKTNRVGTWAFMADDKFGNQYYGNIMLYIKGGDVAKRSHMVSAAATSVFKDIMPGVFDIIEKQNIAPVPQPLPAIPSEQANEKDAAVKPPSKGEQIIIPGGVSEKVLNKMRSTSSANNRSTELTLAAPVLH